MSPLELLEQNIAEKGLAIPAEEWQRLRADLSEITYAAGAVIFSIADVSYGWFFLSSGIAASEQVSPDGEASIARFFEARQFCANLTSTWRQELAPDNLVAITDVEGVVLPDRIFRTEYLRGGLFGEFLRLKAMETLLFDKDLIIAKTSTDTEMRYRFLEQSHAQVIARVPQKDIARFLGVTPQGLSRFLRRTGRRPT
ncbi:MAG: cyclic nucleotide-binding domain-containing protein [Pseudomonadota bacterium]